MYQAMPAYNGFGTEEDSLGSVYSLQPNPPKKDVKKMFKSDMHILRFDAKLVSTEPDDENRKFLVSFFCGDDTIQVYEICDKNSGRLGGKFLERKKHKNPVSGAYYEEKDFLLGTVGMSLSFLGDLRRRVEVHAVQGRRVHGEVLRGQS